MVLVWGLISWHPPWTICAVWLLTANSVTSVCSGGHSKCSRPLRGEHKAEWQKSSALLFQPGFTWTLVQLSMTTVFYQLWFFLNLSIISIVVIPVLCFAFSTEKYRRFCLFMLKTSAQNTLVIIIRSFSLSALCHPETQFVCFFLFVALTLFKSVTVISLHISLLSLQQLLRVP